MGIYEREFNCDTVGRTYLVFEGVCSCAFVYVNGAYAGFTRGSHLRAEFDLTELLHGGENTLTVKVLKWTAGSYLESQDQLRYNGIFREIYLLHRPEGHIEDVEITSTDDSFDISFDGRAEVRIFEGEKLISFAECENNYTYSPESPILWNAEKPFLYRIELERAGEILTFMRGLKKIGIGEDYSLLINGVSVKLHGVNHHDTHPENGWCMTREDMRRDLLLMKELNINCIRTSHYPPHPAFAEMCDELGFYLILETDIEEHGFMSRYPEVIGYEGRPCSDPVWKKEYLERAERAYGTFKNFTSVIMWSTGNESGYGENTRDEIKLLKSKKSDALIHSEDASREQGTVDADGVSADVYSRMYSSLKELRSFAEDEKINMPVFLCEYSHAMGNGPGDVWDYNSLFREYPKLIGGCIWEWADHGVKRGDDLLYGGDFEHELTHDGNFCCDGVVFSDRSFKSGSYEMKAAYQPMYTEYSDGILELTNLYDFTDLSECTVLIETELDGREVSRSELSLTLAPKDKVRVPVSVPEEAPTLGCHLNVYLIKDGRTVAETQHLLSRPVPGSAEESCPAAEMTEDDNSILFRGDGFEYRFSKHSGNFESIVIRGRQQILSPVALSAMRALTDNDKAMSSYWITWPGENLDRLFSKVYSVETDGNGITVTGALSGVSRGPFFRYTLLLKVSSDGKISVCLNGKIREGTVCLPRLGFDYILPGQNSGFEYYGRGPLDCYCDLSHSSKVGRYLSTAAEEYVNYPRPQEHGNHTDTVMLRIGDMLFESSESFEFAVSEYGWQQLQSAEHPSELHRDGNIHLRVDLKSSGVGSMACGPALEEKYRFSEKDISFSFTVSPADASEGY